MIRAMKLADRYDGKADISYYRGDCRTLLQQIPVGAAKLVLTSPPYNIGKPYEKRVSLEKYVKGQKEVIELCVDRLADGGSICWQVGNHVRGPNSIVPLDILMYPFFEELGLTLRNRIIWHFGHGLHAQRRLSGRYETILWFTKGEGYRFDLDAIRVPQKYPGKTGTNGHYSGNVRGKNPGDVWSIPNVKNNHLEKTIHPCQFPVELVERLVLALTKPGDLVVDPYMGVASTAIAAYLHKRRSAGAEIKPQYYRIGLSRIRALSEGALRTRPRDRPIYEPIPGSKLLTRN